MFVLGIVVLRKLKRTKLNVSAQITKGVIFIPKMSLKIFLILKNKII